MAYRSRHAWMTSAGLAAQGRRIAGVQLEEFDFARAGTLGPDRGTAASSGVRAEEAVQIAEGPAGQRPPLSCRTSPPQGGRLDAIETRREPSRAAVVPPEAAGGSVRPASGGLASRASRGEAVETVVLGEHSMVLLRLLAVHFGSQREAIERGLVALAAEIGLQQLARPSRLAALAPQDEGYSDGSAPHPALRATFSPRGRRESGVRP